MSRCILPLLVLGYIVAYLDRVNVGFAKLQMLEDLRFSETVYGLGAGIFFIGYFLFEVPSNVILHRVGARVWIARIMITWGLVSATMTFVTTPGEFYVLRFLLGVAEAGFFPGVIYYLTQWFPAARGGQAMAVFMTAIAICGATGSLLSGAVMQAFHGLNRWAGWQWLFLLEASPALLLGLYILFRMDNDIQGASWLDAQEKALLSADLARDRTVTPEGTYLDALRDRRVWLGCLIYFCAVMGLYGIGFWLPTIVADMGVESLWHVGLFAAIPYAVAAVGMVLVGRSGDRRGEHRWHVALPAFVGAFGLALGVAFSDDTVLALAALSLAAFGLLTVPPLFWSLPTAFLGGGRHCGHQLVRQSGRIRQSLPCGLDQGPDRFDGRGDVSRGGFRVPCRRIGARWRSGAVAPDSGIAERLICSKARLAR